MINKLKEIDDDNLDKFIIFNKLYLSSCTADEKKTYTQEVFSRLLQYIQRLFPLAWQQRRKEEAIQQLIKEISHD